MGGRSRAMRLTCALFVSLALGACGARQAEKISQAEEPMASPAEQAIGAEQAGETSATTQEETSEPAQSEVTTESEETMIRATITVNGQSFEAELEDSDCGRAFAAMLPTELEMSELNGNEKYCYTGSSLPSSPSCPSRIEAGDLMLYGSDCVVLFYKSFDTSYRYTRIGRLIDPTGIAEAVGTGTATVSFTEA